MVQLKNREELHEYLCSVLESRHVFFKRPTYIDVEYPAIVYSRINIDEKYANNSKYIKCEEYRVILIEDEAESDICAKFKADDLFKYDREYDESGLVHTVFRVTI